MRSGLILALAAGFSLLALYVSFVSTFLQANLLAGATVLELSIFTLQLLKVAVIASIKRLRNSPAAVILDILGAELVVLLTALAIVYVYPGIQSAPSLMTQILLAWIAGVATFGTPFAAYRLAKSMLGGESLVGVLPSAVFLSEFMILLTAGANAASVSGNGLPDFTRAMLLVGAGVSTAGGQVTAATALPPLVILYISLLLYALALGESEGPSRLKGLAALALFATAVTYTAAYTASAFAVSLTYVVLPPTLVTVVLMWWGIREA